MTTKLRINRDAIRYSEAFKVSVAREVEASGLAFSAVADKYGIKGADTVQRWARKYGTGTRGKVVRVEKPDEIACQKPMTAPEAACCRDTIAQDAAKAG